MTVICMIRMKNGVWSTAFDAVPHEHRTKTSTNRGPTLFHRWYLHQPETRNLSRYVDEANAFKQQMLRYGAAGPLAGIHLDCPHQQSFARMGQDTWIFRSQ